MTTWFRVWYFLVKVQFRGPELFKKKGTLFQEELYLPGIFIPSWTSWWYDCGWLASIWMWFNVFANMILPYGSHCIDMTASPEPINSVVGTWLSCFAMCDWLRALVHLHCDVMITTSGPKHGGLADRQGSTCHAYGRKFTIKIQC